MRFWKRAETENTEPPTLLGVPGMPRGTSLSGSPYTRHGRLFIIVPYEYPAHVDVRSEGAMKYLCTFGTRPASAA